MNIKNIKTIWTYFIFLFVSAILNAQDITTIENEYLKVNISSRGAEIQQIISKETGKQYVWNGDEKIWKNRAPLMFPISVRYKNNEYTYKGEYYTMPMMGLLMRSKVEIDKVDNSSLSYIFKSTNETKKYYPFDFCLTIKYKLKKNELIHEFVIENTGENLMYYDLGGHPGFALSLENNKTRDNYQFTFSESVTKPRYPIVNGLKQISEVPFLKNDQFIDISDERMPEQGGILLLDFPKNTLVGIAEKGKQPFVEFNIGNFNNLNLWAPSEKPLLAFEPMLGHHDGQESPIAIENKPQVVVLKPQSKESYYFSLYLY